MPDAGASRKRQIPVRRIPCDLATFRPRREPTESLVEAGSVWITRLCDGRGRICGADRATAVVGDFPPPPICWIENPAREAPGSGCSRRPAEATLQARKTRVSASARSRAIRCGAEHCACASTNSHDAVRFARRSATVPRRRRGHADSARVGARKGKPARRVPAQRSARQMELIENSVMEQRLAMKVRSRLRVICATPIQKRLESHRSKRFLCCVCRSVRGC